MSAEVRNSNTQSERLTAVQVIAWSTLVFTGLRQGTDKCENIPDERSIIEFRIGF